MTRLRADVERLRLIHESVVDYAIVTLDRDGAIVDWNAGAERIFGYTPAEVLGCATDLIFTPEDRAAGAHVAEMQRAEQAGRAEDERWHLGKGECRLYVSGVLFPLRVDNVLIGYVKIARDATRRKLTEEAERQEKGELEARVAERTLELRRVVDTLHAEVADRRTTEERIKALFKQIVHAQEEERKRIARDIHDDVGQQMTALRIHLDSLRANADLWPRLAGKTARAQQLAEELDRSIDFLIWQLRPPVLDLLGLPAALTQLVTNWSERFDIPAECDTSRLDGCRLAPDVETNLYRIAQEALHNVYKHANATRVTVYLGRQGERAVLVIEDDGRGFNQASSQMNDGLGLLNMRERATLIGGEFELESAIERGTALFVRVPISPESSTTR